MNAFKEMEKKKLELRYVLGQNIENNDPRCRHSRFINDLLLSPELHTSKSQDLRLLDFLRTITMKHVLKCSLVTTRLATMNTRIISILFCFSQATMNAWCHRSG